MRPGSQGGAKLETRGAGPGGPPGPVSGNPPAGGSPGWRRQPSPPLPAQTAGTRLQPAQPTAPAPRPRRAAVPIRCLSHGGCNPPASPLVLALRKHPGQPWSRPHFRDEQTESRGGTPVLQGPRTSPQAHPVPAPTALPGLVPPFARWRHSAPHPPPCLALLLSDAPPFSRMLATAGTLVGGCARLPGPLGDAGLDFPETLPLASLHPWTSWGPLLRVASPNPSHLPLPAGVSVTSPLSPSHPRHLCGAGRAASPHQEHQRGPELRAEPCPQHHHVENPRVVSTNALKLV